MVYKEEYKPEASGYDEPTADNYNYTEFAYQVDKPKIGYWNFSDNSAHYENIPAMCSEAIGAFIFIFLFMLCTDKKTQYSEDKVINCFILSASYCAARLMGAGGLVTVINKSYQIQTVDAEDSCVDGNWVYQ